MNSIFMLKKYGGNGAYRFWCHCALLVDETVTENIGKHKLFENCCASFWIIFLFVQIAYVYAPLWLAPNVYLPEDSRSASWITLPCGSVILISISLKPPSTISKVKPTIQQTRQIEKFRFNKYFAYLPTLRSSYTYVYVDIPFTTQTPQTYPFWCRHPLWHDSNPVPVFPP